jgi:hypothetical protein
VIPTAAIEDSMGAILAGDVVSFIEVVRLWGFGPPHLIFPLDRDLPP